MKIHSATLMGVEALPVDVEVDVAAGAASFHVVGLPTTAAAETRVRVQSALINTGYKLPRRRVTVCVAPTDLPKDASVLDLPLAVSLAVAHELAPPSRLERYVFLGELGLDGTLRPVRGLLPAAQMAARRGLGVVVPLGNAGEAAMAGVEALGARHLGEVLAFLRGKELPRGDAPPADEASAGDEDLADVRGQEHAKEALAVAAAGGFHVLLGGPPGCGKTMLARRLPGILPPLGANEALEVAAVQSAAGLLGPRGLPRRRPFRAPHHTISKVALVGGGTLPRPGELSLAHGGVLFLDELPEFPPWNLGALIGALKASEATITRAGYTVRLPARAQVVAAMNPCPCGHAGDSNRACSCNEQAIARYWRRVRPFIDDLGMLRVDLRRPGTGAACAPGLSTAEVRARAQCARAAQQARLVPHGLRTNSEIPAGLLDQLCALATDGHAALERAGTLFALSTSAVDRVRRVARTIADLEAPSQPIDARHVQRAIALSAVAYPTM